ncbi:MAG: DNA polymerase I, partial [Gammaproteobacteria bacterium]
MTHTKPLVLVDASSYLYRAFYAMPPLTNSQGLPTGAVYGVVNMVRKLLAEQEPAHIAMVFDAKGRTFRDDLYEQYKAHRPRMPDDLSVQIAPLHAIIHAMGLPLLLVDGVEADDVIGTLTCQATELGMSVQIYTGDKDLAQLVNAQVTLINTMNNSVLDPQGVIDKFGIPAERIIDYLALVGDSSDNIPGVPKVGPSTAVKWLKQYGTLDSIIEHAGEVGGKVGENLRAALAQLPIARALLTVKCDVPLDVTPLDLRPRLPDVETLRELYKKLEFKAWLAQTARKPAAPGAVVATETLAVETVTVTVAVYETIVTLTQLDAWLTGLTQVDLICFDIKTTSLDYMQAQIAGIAFALPTAPEGVSAAYIPLAHDCENTPQQLERALVLERLRPLLEDAQRTKLGHDIKFACHVLANHGIRLAGARFDTMLESYLLDSTATRHDLDSLALKYLDGRASSLAQIAGKGVRQLSFHQIAIDLASAHAAEQAALILRLHNVLWPQLSALENLQRLFTHMEMPLAGVLARIERNGVGVDRAMLHRQSAELAARMDELEQQAHVLAGQPFNLGSPLQIQEILYDKLGLPVLQKTPKGQPSTAESVLQELALDYPLPKLILEHRGLSKLKSTYTDSLPEQINPATARVHTCYHQAVTATGRLSSSNPNLQNIPIRSAAGRRIRQAFVAAPGY